MSISVEEKDAGSLDIKAANALWEKLLCKSPLTSNSFVKLDSPVAKHTRSSTSQTNILCSCLSKYDDKLQERHDKVGNKNSKKRKIEQSNKKILKPLKVTTNKVKKLQKFTEQTKETKDLFKYSKKSNKPKLRRLNSASSDELPTFKGRIPCKKTKQTESFKKYGIIIPSIDFVLEDQNHLTHYKTQVDEALNLENPKIKMPNLPKKANKSRQQAWLDCKQLTLSEITHYFNNSILFLHNIMEGKHFSDRHKWYFEEKKQQKQFNTEELTYNTSTIVFSFEQLNWMVSLMQVEFDPEDQMTEYFFKVLLPELCFKIFMDYHGMSRRQATKYLEDRPVQ